jgi:hypothetical protein
VPRFDVLDYLGYNLRKNTHATVEYEQVPVKTFDPKTYKVTVMSPTLGREMSIPLCVAMKLDADAPGETAKADKPAPMVYLVGLPRGVFVAVPVSVLGADFGARNMCQHVFLGQRQ